MTSAPLPPIDLPAQQLHPHHDHQPQRSPSHDVASPSITSTRTLDFSDADDHDHDHDHDDDADLSDSAIAGLLREAEQRMRAARTAISTDPDQQQQQQQQQKLMTTFPKLDPGEALPVPPIVSEKGVARVVQSRSRSRAGATADSEEAIAANTAARLAAKKKDKSAPAPTAGPQWFDMPRTNLADASVKRDLQLLKARNVLDPHRHYKKDSSKAGFATYSQVGTVIEGPAETFSARINRRDRRRTMADEILADDGARKRFKTKYDEAMQSRRSGKKEFYRKLKEQRKRAARK